MSLSSELVDDITEHASHFGGYDLEEVNLGPVALMDWGGFPITKFRYTKTNPNGSVRNGLAVMLNPRPEQVARWAVSAAVFTGTANTRELARKVVREIGNASGFHFLVRGVHLENMSGAGFKAYPFMDGVTLKLGAIPAGYPSSQLTDAQLESACAATYDEVTSVGKYARVISTTRTELEGFQGAPPGVGPGWCATVGNMYRSSWGHDSNPLVTSAVVARRALWGF